MLGQAQKPPDTLANSVSFTSPALGFRSSSVISKPFCLAAAMNSSAFSFDSFSFSSGSA